jgi:hypothetical protein
MARTLLIQPSVRGHPPVVPLPKALREQQRKEGGYSIGCCERLPFGCCRWQSSASERKTMVRSEAFGWPIIYRRTARWTPYQGGAYLAELLHQSQRNDGSRLHEGLSNVMLVYQQYIRAYMAPIDSCSPCTTPRQRSWGVRWRRTWPVASPIVRGNTVLGCPVVGRRLAEQRMRISRECGEAGGPAV